MPDDKVDFKKRIREEKKVVAIEKINIEPVVVENKVTSKGADIE